MTWGVRARRPAAAAGLAFLLTGTGMLHFAVARAAPLVVGPDRLPRPLGESVSDRSARRLTHRAHATRRPCYTVCCSRGLNVTFRRSQISTWSRAGVVPGAPEPGRLLYRQLTRSPARKGTHSWRVIAPLVVIGGLPRSYSPLPPAPNLTVRIACPGQGLCCVVGP
jgi:hypothetical protein